MKVYIQTDSKGDYYNINAFNAAVGFDALAFDVIKYFDIEEVQDTKASTIFVGGIAMVRKRLATLGITKQNEIEYPAELDCFLNRKIWKSSLKKIISEKQKNLFIKPLETKLFQGKVISNFKDYIGLNFDYEVKVWCSEVVDIVTEWRCFVRYGRLLDVRYYKGEWDSKLDLTIVKKAIKIYQKQPASYCLDFGVDAKGKHYLIEVNDGHSLGAYGMGAVSYAKFLSARWAELTETEDLLNF